MRGSTHSAARPARWPNRAICGMLLLGHALLLAWGAYRHSPTIDEWGYLPAGLMHWREGRFDIFRVNPPLVRLVATWPLLFHGPATDKAIPEAKGSYRPERDAAWNLYLRYGANSFAYFTIARIACIPLSLIGAIVCCRWAADLYGRRAGMAALTLWCLCPNVLAHAQLITPDVGATAVGLAAHYLYWRWLCLPRWSMALLVGGMLGLTLLTKATWVLLFVLWPAIWLAMRRPLPRIRRGGFSEWGQFLAMLLIALGVLNAAYGFDGSFTRLGDYQFVSRTLCGSAGNHASGPLHDGTSASVGNRFRGGWLEWCPVPFPRDFVAGIDVQKRDFESGFWSYLRGEWRQRGWWYYYLYAMGVKMPLGVLSLLLLSCLTALSARHRVYRAEWYLLAPACAVIGFVSLQTGFNHHLRYVLPAFPYLFIFGARVFACRLRTLRLCAGGLFTWAVISSLMIYPHSLSYFNEIAGGPRNGPAHLLHSNVDWGQDLILLREWVDEHRDVVLEGVALPMCMPSRLIGVAAPAPAGRATPGWYAVSVDRLHDVSGRYRYFFCLEPADFVGYSTCIYRVTPQDADRLRGDIELRQRDGGRSAPGRQTDNGPNRFAEGG